jgi:hypothetical protein
MHKVRVVVLSLSVALSPIRAYSGQYQQKCEQAGKKAQAQCTGAAGAANAGDRGQAGALGSTIGAGATVNPAAGAMMSQAAGQIGRMSGALGACEQAKEQCEQECSQQQQSAQGDQKARQQGEPGQVSQSKEKSCSSPLAGMIGPLMAALAAAMAALAQAKNTDKESKNQQKASATPTTQKNEAEKKDPEKAATGSAGFEPLKIIGNEPVVKMAIASIEKAGGKVSSKGVTLANGGFQSWSSIAQLSSASPGEAGGAEAEGGFRAVSLENSKASGFKANGMREDESEGEAAQASYGSSDPFSGSMDAQALMGPANTKTADGMQINFDGTPIGAKADNIFKMMTRAYDRKRQSAHFYGEYAPEERAKRSVASTAAPVVNKPAHP